MEAAEQRRNLATAQLKKGRGGLKNVSYPVLRFTTLEPSDLIHAAKELDIEGIIAKRKGSIY